MVALVALESGMLSIEHITGAPVIKRGCRRVPMDEREVSAVVVGMA